MLLHEKNNNIFDCFWGKKYGDKLSLTLCYFIYGRTRTKDKKFTFTVYVMYFHFNFCIISCHIFFLGESSSWILKITTNEDKIIRHNIHVFMYVKVGQGEIDGAK